MPAKEVTIGYKGLPKSSRVFRIIYKRRKGKGTCLFVEFFWVRTQGEILLVHTTEVAIIVQGVREGREWHLNGNLPTP